MMQSLTQTWYLTCGKSRGHTIFFASLKLVGQVFPLGRRSCQNVMFSSKHVSVILCFTFISRAMSATFRPLGIASFIQWSNRIYLKLIQLEFLSGGNSCVITRLVQKQLLKMRVMHPVHR